MKKTISTLNNFEWTLLWMAIRYAMNRQTISSATLPQDIMREYYHRLTEEQKAVIVRDLKENMDEHTGGAFGDPNIDRPIWMKFMRALDPASHLQAILVDGSTITIFKVGDKVFPLHKYIEEPHYEYFVPEESIAIAAK